MKTWINHLSKRDNYLHKIAQQTVCTLYGCAVELPHFEPGYYSPNFRETKSSSWIQSHSPIDWSAWKSELRQVNKNEDS